MCSASIGLGCPESVAQSNVLDSCLLHDHLLTPLGHIIACPLRDTAGGISQPYRNEIVSYYIWGGIHGF